MSSRKGSFLFQVISSSVEEDLRCWERDIFSIAREGALDNNLYHSWRFKGSHKGGRGDRFSKGLVPNRRERVSYLSVSMCGAIGDYFQIW